MKKINLSKIKIILRNFINLSVKTIKNINISKFKHLITIAIVLILIFLIPIVFGSMSNGSYEKINQTEKNNAINKFSLGKGKLIDIDTSIVKVYTSDKVIKEVNLEDYVKGVVSTELPLSFEVEAMKAQGILARTFVLSKMITPCSIAKEHGGVICDTVHCQVYKPMEERISTMGSKSDKFREKVESAVNKTKNEVLTYEGLLVRYPQYFSMSSGKTENGSDVFKTDAKYLKSVVSVWDEDLPNFKVTTEYSNSEFVQIVNNKYPKANLQESNLKSLVKILSRTDGGSVEQIRLGDVSIKGTDFRMMFNIRSANFTIDFGEGVKINCKGYGHGVGMSQWGANSMAKEGNDFEEIIKHYYTGVDITNIKNTRVE